MRIEIALLTGLILTPVAAQADTTETIVGAYDGSVRKAFARETKSQCLARMRATTDEIIVCGAAERKDKYRTTRGGYVLATEAVIQSPAERFHETKALIAASQNNVGIGYTSSITGIKKGYLRGSYKLASRLLAGEDPDYEDQ